MIEMRTAEVVEIISQNELVQNLFVKVNGEKQKAVNYPKLCGYVLAGDTVLLNTTAVTLGLGTGGMHFVICNISNSAHNIATCGHIMKLRYTPYQIKCNTLEEQSIYRQIFNTVDSIDRMPVCVLALHSMLPPIVSNIKAERPCTRICYVMTDGAALPLWISKSIAELKEKELIDFTITAGHAFGGDYECINTYTALIAAKHIFKADITIIGMGPGIVGTNTKYGFSGIEQGHIIDCVNTLNGICLAVPRVSFSDNRQRHYGLSHHSITVLNKICKSRANVIFSNSIDTKCIAYLQCQLKENHIDKKHDIYFIDDDTEKNINLFNINVSTMGRSFKEDSAFFKNSGASGKYAIELL